MATTREIHGRTRLQFVKEKKSSSACMVSFRVSVATHLHTITERERERRGRGLVLLSHVLLGQIAQQGGLLSILGRVWTVLLGTLWREEEPQLVVHRVVENRLIVEMTVRDIVTPRTTQVDHQVMRTNCLRCWSRLCRDHVLVRRSVQLPNIRITQVQMLEKTNHFHTTWLWICHECVEASLEVVKIVRFSPVLTQFTKKHWFLVT